MQLDLRLPIGLMFALLGAILAIYGLVTGSHNEMYQKSLGINVNLWCGLLYLAFGAIMLILASRSRRPEAHHEGTR
jgi:hypothetical protein